MNSAWQGLNNQITINENPLAKHQLELSRFDCCRLCYTLIRCKKGIVGQQKYSSNWVKERKTAFHSHPTQSHCIYVTGAHKSLRETKLSIAIILIQHRIYWSNIIFHNCCILLINVRPMPGILPNEVILRGCIFIPCKPANITLWIAGFTIHGWLVVIWHLAISSWIAQIPSLNTCYIMQTK